MAYVSTDGLYDHKTNLLTFALAVLYRVIIEPADLVIRIKF